MNLQKAFVLTALIAFGSLTAYSISGCSSGPTSPGAGAGMQTTTIYGRITDESGVSLMGVSVSAGTKTAITDANGFFILKDATVPKGRAVVIAKKAGYFNAAKAEAPSTNGTRIEMSMMTDVATANVSATSGGTVNVAGGASIVFSGGSFTDPAGAAYTGKVNVSARYLDPKNVSFFDYFSGDDMAQASSGKNVSLISSGVLRVELKDQNGQTLKLDASKPATLSFPKPIDTKAPTVMPLWYFDESLGMWKEDGSATLKNGMYSGTVTHFTDWNLDYYDSSGQFGAYGSVSLRVVCNTMPIGGVVMTIVGDDVTGKYFVHPGGKTGPDGRITFIRFPANRPTQIDIRSDRNGGVFYINSPINVNITPGQTLDLGDITLNSPCPASIKGALTGCDDAKTEGLITISDGKNLNYIYTMGDFAVQAAAGIPLTVDAIDVNGNAATTVSVPTLASGEQRDIGNIKVCGTATSNFIDIPISSNKEGQLIGLSPDGTRLAAFIPSQLTVYDSKTGQILSQGNVTSANTNYYHGSLQFSTDNSKVLFVSDYGETQLYDVSGAAIALLISIPNVTGAKLYDDGSKIIVVKSMGYPNPPVINIYNVSDGSVKATLHPTMSGGSDSLSSFGFIRDEDAIIFPDDKSGSDHIWSVATDAEIRNFPVTGASYTFAASEDGLTVASSADYVTYSCYDTKTGLKAGDVKIGGNNGTRYGNTVLTKNSAYVADQVSGANVIRIFKISDGTSTIKLLSGTNYVASVAASRNEQYLAAVTSGKIRIWKLQ